MDGINVLSLFDGMSCGRLALERAGIKVNKYYASEIDKHAIAVTMHNYPNTKQLGDVTKLKIKLLCLSDVYSYICKYDINLQSNIREWEVLYWLDKNFTFSAKIGTQEPNEGQKVSKSSSIQSIEEVWFSNREMGSVRKFGDYTRSGSNGKENDIRTPQQLQCSEWRYDNDIYRRYKEENIGIAIRETKNGDSEKKNFGNIEETVFKGKESENYFGENEKSNVEEGCSGELLEREGEDRFSRTVKKEKRNGRAEKNSFIDEIVRELCGWNETDGIAQDYWNILRLHKEEQVTVVEYEGGYHIFKGKIDLLCGGSPCQSFSFAGKRKGMSTKCETEILTLEHYLELKNEGYEFEGQSYLFWEYMRLLNEVKPKYFLLENVIMGEKWEKILSKAIGVKPIQINSALVSAQNRNRLYWTNIGMQPMGLFGDLESIIPQPKDKGILLKDILESEVDAKYYLSQQRIETMLKSERSVAYVDEETKKFNCLLAGYNKIPTDGQYVVHNTMPRSSTNGNGGTGHLSRTDGKTYCPDTGNANAVEIQCVAMRGREAVLTPKRTEYGKAIRKDYEAGNIETQRKNIQQLEPRTDGKTNTLTSVQKDNLVMQLNPSTESGGKQPYQQNRIYDTDGISPALMAQMSCGTHAIKHERKIRRLTPLECERLQTVKDNEISCIFALCLEKAKNYVDAVSQNPKLLKLVLNAENSELNEIVKNVLLNMNANHQSIKHTAPQNVDMQIQKVTKKCTNCKQQENNLNVNNAELIAMSNCQKVTEGSAQQNVFMNITEGRIIHFGLEELHQKDNRFTNLLNGGNPLELFGNEIMELAKGAIAETTKKQGTNFTYTTLYRSNTKSLEQALIIYYLFAKNVIIGSTQNTIQLKSLLLKFNLKDGYTSVASDSQRYRMIGNGWTVDVIAHILSYGEWS